MVTRKAGKKSAKQQVPRERSSLNSFIRDLEQDRNSKVILYFTGERQPAEQLATQIGQDVLVPFRKILESISDANKISLVLNTSGGNSETPWPLVNLIREYCKEFEVVVLEKALSAGTMIALGADAIVMFPYSQLSPIDPQRQSIDGNKQLTSLEIEDIISFVDFTKDKVGVNEQSALAEVVKELAKEVKPSVLGSINRTHSLIRRLAINLLSIHKKKMPERQIKEITEHLTQKLYSHRHLINRKEAKDMVGFDDMIEFAKPVTKEIAENILAECYTIMELEKAFNPIEFMSESTERDVELTRAIIYSLDIRYNFKSTYHIIKTPDPSGNMQLVVNNTLNEWRKE